MNFTNNEKTTDTIRKRRTAYDGHLQRTNSNRFTGIIFRYTRKLKMANTWINKTENDIGELQITDEDLTERYSTQEQATYFKGLQEKPRRKTGSVWTEERREKHKERMREIWRERKNEGRKQLKQTQSIVAYTITAVVQR